MLNSITLIRQSRTRLIAVLNSLSENEHNALPPSFNNNIIWNAGHLIATIQLLCYKNSGLNNHVDESFVARYRKGTRPDSDVTTSEIQQIKKDLLASVDRLEGDYKSGLFQTYEPYMTSFGVKLNSIDDAIDFLVMHEGIHLGYVMAMKRNVNHS